MGVLIKWKSIDPEATYNQARVYRATSREGTYSLLTTQDMTDQSYYDPDGTTNMWYKVDFYNSTNTTVSALSDPIKGGTYKGYCTVDDVRHICNLTTNDITDTQICNLIEYTTRELNADINVHHEEERLDYINSVKDNELNANNTTFYTEDYPIGDNNDDGAVDTTDITVWEYSSDGESRSQVTVSSIVPNEGKLVLSNAPASDVILKVTYKSCQRSASDPHALIPVAAALLTTAWAYTKINVGKAPRWQMGSTKIWRDMKSFDTYYNKYLKIVAKINDRSLGDSIEADNLM